MTSTLYLGIMSGTSLDGVDLALVDFSEKHSPQMLATDFEPMPNDLRTTLSDLIKSGETNLQTLGELDHRLGLLYADCVNRFLQKSGFPAQQIQAIGCHGQTVWHAPQSAYPFTMQIGDMHLLASKTSITTVGDFRRKDMAVGGQGAPLVPAFHEAIFAQKDRLTVVLNIGGISNISVLNPNQPTIGYDVGVGNALMDSWIERHQGKRYDKNGDWAKTGEVLSDLLARLLDEPFFRLPPPKSTGRELFNLAWLEQKISNADYRPKDVQRTLAEFTAQSIANALRPLATTAFEQSPRLLVCGGGARNPLLMDRLAALCPTWLVATTTDFGWDIDFVEAAAFAWLAHQRMVGLPSNLPSVTGAKQAVSLGGVFPKN